MMELGESRRMGSYIALRLMSPAGATELVKGADVLARAFVEVFADPHGFATCESVLADDFVAYLPYSRYPIRGREKYEDWMKQFRSGFSDFQCDIDELIDEARLVKQQTDQGRTQQVERQHQQQTQHLHQKHTQQKQRPSDGRGSRGGGGGRR
jgi:hypothetical protein